MKIEQITFGMLLLILSSRCFIQWMPTFNLAIISTFISVLGQLLLLFCFVYTFKRKKIFQDSFLIVGFVALYVIFSIFVYYQEFVSPMMSVDNMKSVPHSAFSLIQASITILLLGMCTKTILEKLDHILFAKTSTIVIIVFSIFYFRTIDVAIYTQLFDTPQNSIEAIMPNGFIDGLTMAKFIGLAFCCNLYLFDKWSEKRIVNYLIFLLVFAYCVVIQFLMAERGPVVFMIFTFSIFLYFKKIIRSRSLFFVFLFLLFALLFQDDILSGVYSITPEIVERYLQMIEDGGTGRFGSNDSLYSLSWEQFLSGPFWGSYFRMLHATFLGYYPHNVFIEFLWVFGLIFSVPMYIYIFHAIKWGIKSIKSNQSSSLWSIMFIYFFFCRITSGTIVCDEFFWFPFFVMILNNHKTQLKWRMN